MSTRKDRKNRRSRPIEPITPCSEGEALFLEQAAAYYQDMMKIGNDAPAGRLIDMMESFAVVRSRELIKTSFEEAIQEQVERIEKKKETVIAEEMNDIGDTAKDKL